MPGMPSIPVIDPGAIACGGRADDRSASGLACKLKAWKLRETAGKLADQGRGESYKDFADAIAAQKIPHRLLARRQRTRGRRAHAERLWP
jgi:hypothetical protein